MVQPAVRCLTRTAIVALLPLVVTIETAAQPTADAEPTLVEARNSTQTDLGFFQPGTYYITATGIICATSVTPCDVPLGPDGIPHGRVTAAGYEYMNPSGSDVDINTGLHGPAGVGFLLGSLVGAVSSGPRAGEWFLIGKGTTIVLASAGNIYAQVNDTYYPNNVGSFSVELALSSPQPTPTAVRFVQQESGNFASVDALTYADAFYVEVDFNIAPAEVEHIAMLEWDGGASEVTVFRTEENPLIYRSGMITLRRPGGGTSPQP